MTAGAFAVRQRMRIEHIEDDPQRPWPDEQIFLSNPGRERYVCGTRTVEALFAWFGRFMPELLEEGGNVGEYEVPPAAIGVSDGCQIIYMQRQATLVRRTGRAVDPASLIERIHPTKR